MADEEPRIGATSAFDTADRGDKIGRSQLPYDFIGELLRNQLVFAECAHGVHIPVSEAAQDAERIVKFP